MLRGAVTLCLMVAAAVAQEDFFEDYGRQKIMTNCFGEDLYYKQLDLFTKAQERCRSEPLYIPGLQQPTHTYNVIRPGLIPTNIGYGYQVPVVPAFPTGHIPTTHTHATGYQTPVQVIAKGRQTRQVGDELFVDRDDILGIIGTVHAALSNFTCTLRVLDAIDDNLNIRVDNIQRQYYQVPVEPVLRKDMLDGINLCYQLSACLPVDLTKNPLPPKLQRILFFTKCERKARVSNCFKHDLRRNLFRFDLTAIPEGGNVGKLEKLAALIVGAGSLDELKDL